MFAGQVPWWSAYRNADWFGWYRGTKCCSK